MCALVSIYWPFLASIDKTFILGGDWVLEYNFMRFRGFSDLS